ncbi:type IV pilin protein [Halanaerobacter jeridensis]|uniref:Prepilin-type N-terminal cleavage/methylation domain-containing protein n=1 Tax=Halanaerobacter jeridensis TaxID=706427 RepID=A0A938XSB2_9FIRM|nr:prepilin-type N-terminal cleavage/methylation domain-containing protein [Halanaerobacter jeridensis]MBM7556889.1 prepilin-type N-terminal cleavage/methylation domain-containing protein [Halanaerobacter jeridensis]
MLKRIREGFSAEAGFTLIELMLVVAVLGIIAGIAVPQITGVRNRAAMGKLESTANTIRNAMEREKSMSDTGVYPSLTEGEQTLSDLSGDLTNTDLSGDDSITVTVDSSGDDAYSITLSSPNADNDVIVDDTGISTSTN